MAQIFKIINDHSISFSKIETPNVHYPVMREAKRLKIVKKKSSCDDPQKINQNKSRNEQEMLTNNICQNTEIHLYSLCKFFYPT